MGAQHSLSWEDAVLSLRGQAEHQGLVRACFYDDPLLQAAQRYHASSEWAAVRSLLGTACGAALDVGSGRGISAYALAKDGWRVTALEPDASSVVGAGAVRELAQQAQLPIDVVQTWGEQLPFEAESFELVHCRQVLHHARDLQRLCREVARVLRPGGILLATREHVISSHADLQVFLDGHPLHRLYGGENAFVLGEYTRAIQEGGLTLRSVFNPLESDINLYPETRADVKRRWARRLRLPWPALIPDAALRLAGSRKQTPGRLFTFMAVKPVEAS